MPANDTASLSLTADDGLLASDAVGLPIEYQSVDYVRLRIPDRDPLLNPWPDENVVRLWRIGRWNNRTDTR